MIALAGAWREKFVEAIYATHNDSAPIRAALAQLLPQLESTDIGLNIGAGHTKLHPRILNVDIQRAPSVHCCARAEHLPFRDGSVSLIVTQETLEHVYTPHKAMSEIARVLNAGGTLYCQVPFIIGYHPGPTDYWRFSKEGIRALAEQAGLLCDVVEIAVGPGTGFYRIAVEFTAVCSSRLNGALYYPAKAAAAVVLFPLKMLDNLLIGTQQEDRVAGGYYMIARKVE